ncbi:hypothetical protein [Streptomyces sp. NPDC047046]|uniref:hypothetical protein n=1 Tax=Streptomyces sp. NPDC047046 TaxID=3155378 RepID=UPI0033CD8553
MRGRPIGRGRTGRELRRLRDLAERVLGLVPVPPPDTGTQEAGLLRGLRLLSAATAEHPHPAVARLSRTAARHARTESPATPARLRTLSLLALALLDAFPAPAAPPRSPCAPARRRARLRR